MPVENFGHFMNLVRYVSIYIFDQLSNSLNNLSICPYKEAHYAMQVPAPLGIGTVELDDGDVVKGFICEAWVKDAALSGDSNCTEITHLGGWLPFVEGNQEK